MPTLAEILELLDSTEALEMNDPPDVWPIAGNDSDLHEVDWEGLFPSPRDRVTDGEQWLNDDLKDYIGGGGDSAAQTLDGPPGWDACAWYQPIHFHGPAWGIYIDEKCVLDVGRTLYVLAGSPPLTDPVVKMVMRAAFSVLFLHEQYHHKTESMAIRMHVIQQQPVYARYFRSVYVPAGGSDDQIEEGLANADSYRRLVASPYRTSLRREMIRATRSFLMASFRLAPPGYRLASRLLTDSASDPTEALLTAQVQEGQLVPRRPQTQHFRIATNLNKSLFNIRQNIWIIVPRGSAPHLPTRPDWISGSSQMRVGRG